MPHIPWNHAEYSGITSRSGKVESPNRAWRGNVVAGQRRQRSPEPRAGDGIDDHASLGDVTGRLAVDCQHPGDGPDFERDANWVRSGSCAAGATG